MGANDNILAGLAGALQGAANVAVPFFKTKLEQELLGERERKKAEQEKISVGQFETLTGNKTGLSPDILLPIDLVKQLIPKPPVQQFLYKPETGEFLQAPPGEIKVAPFPPSPVKSTPTLQEEIEKRKALTKAGIEAKAEAESVLPKKSTAEMANMLKNVEGQILNVQKSARDFENVGFIGGVSEFLTSQTGRISSAAARYDRQRPAFAAGLYRALTGDTRLSDADAQARALPLIPRSIDAKKFGREMFSDILSLLNNKAKLLQQGKDPFSGRTDISINEIKSELNQPNEIGEPDVSATPIQGKQNKQQRTIELLRQQGLVR